MVSRFALFSLLFAALLLHADTAENVIPDIVSTISAAFILQVRNDSVL
jgi:hypothetical protein